jgi:hypothetical protein
MRTKNTIAKIILLSGLAIALTACGSSKSALLGSRVPTASAGGTAVTSLEGYWLGSCGGLTGIGLQQSFAFTGSTYTLYQDQYSADDSSCSNSPISTTQTMGSFQLTNQSSEPMIEFMPSNGQASYAEYALSGTSLQLIQTDQATGLSSPASGVFTLYTGN